MYSFNLPSHLLFMFPTGGLLQKLYVLLNQKGIITLLSSKFLKCFITTIQ